MLEAGILPMLLAAMGADVTEDAATVQNPTAARALGAPEDQKAASALMAELSVHPLGRRELQALAEEQARRNQEAADKAAKAKRRWSKGSKSISLARQIKGYIDEDQT